MKAVIIDNEAGIIEGLSKMLQIYCPEVELVNTADSVESGMHLLMTTDPDLVFLDVELDDGTGLELLGKLPSRDFQVIFITAYNKYAVDAFKFSALDYLLKPIDPDDLIVSVQKAKEHLEKEHLQIRLSVLLENMEQLSQQVKKIILKDAENVHLIPISDIIACEADGSYTRFFLQNQQEILVSKNLKEYEKLLKNYGFFRSHHSFLVNLNNVVRFDKTDGGVLVMKNDQRMPVSFRRREQLLGILANI